MKIALVYVISILSSQSALAEEFPHQHSTAISGNCNAVVSGGNSNSNVNCTFNSIDDEIAMVYKRSADARKDFENTPRDPEFANKRKYLDAKLDGYRKVLYALDGLYHDEQERNRRADEEFQEKRKQDKSTGQPQFTSSSFNIYMNKP